MLQKSKYFFLFATFFALFFMRAESGYSSEPKQTIGIVNFASCMAQSKSGKQEQAAFDALKTQMTSLMEDTEKQLNEIGAKFNNAEYIDGLSPEAEQELKNKYQALAEEMNRYQNQYHQMLSQANMRMMQTLVAGIQEASSSVAEKQKLSMILHKDACFFSTPVLDVTDLVVAEMDKAFDLKHSPKGATKEGITAEARPIENREAKVKK